MCNKLLFCSCEQQQGVAELTLASLTADKSIVSDGLSPAFFRNCLFSSTNCSTSSVICLARSDSPAMQPLHSR